MEKAVFLLGPARKNRLDSGRIEGLDWAGKCQVFGEVGGGGTPIGIYPRQFWVEVATLPATA